MICVDRSLKKNVYGSFSKITFCIQDRRSLSEQIRKFYFGDNAISEETLSNFLDLGTDFNFVWGIVQSAKTLAAHSKGKTFYTV